MELWELSIENRYFGFGFKKIQQTKLTGMLQICLYELRLIEINESQVSFDYEL